MRDDELQLRKDLGQHFLTRSEVCRPLVDFLAPAGRLVVEIGPGAGALTRALLDAGSRVLAWELDPRWAATLAGRFPGEPLSTVVGDATLFPWERLPANSLVAGNLPYNVATPIIRRLLAASIEAAAGPERAAFLVQREVAERMAATPATPAYGALSVLCSSLARVDVLGIVRPGAFRPPPRVDSAFVGLTPIAMELDGERWRRFERLIHASFAKRRKTLRNSLAGDLGRERAGALIDAAGLTVTTRAETLSVQDFLGLLRAAERLGVDEALLAGSSRDRSESA